MKKIYLLITIGLICVTCLSTNRNTLLQKELETARNEGSITQTRSTGKAFFPDEKPVEVLKKQVKPAFTAIRVNTTNKRSFPQSFSICK